MFEGGPREIALREAGVPVIHLGFCRFTAAWQVPRNAIGIRQTSPLSPAGPTGRTSRFSPAQLPHSRAGRTNREGSSPRRRPAEPGHIQGGPKHSAERLNASRLGPRTYSSPTPTRWLRTPCARSRVPIGKIAVVYNGLPDAAFTELAPADIETTHPVILCVANLKAYKGHRYLLEAVARLQSRARPCTLFWLVTGRTRPTRTSRGPAKRGCPIPRPEHRGRTTPSTRRRGRASLAPRRNEQCSHGGDGSRTASRRDQRWRDA